MTWKPTLGWLLLMSAMILSAADAVKLPPKEKFHLFLLAGQSNMAGRGEVLPEDRKPDERILMLNAAGEWVPATDPVHYDKPGAGVGPARSFARALTAADPTVTVGLIPAACGGSSIRQWEPGAYWRQTRSHPYDDAVQRTRRAQQDGTLKAILWHQGESDANAGGLPEYEPRLTRMIAAFRRDLQMPDLPFIAGQLSRPAKGRWSENRSRFDAALRRALNASPPSALVPSDGLTLNRDRIHFDRKSQQEFGKRYFEAYRSLRDATSSSR